MGGASAFSAARGAPWLNAPTIGKLHRSHADMTFTFRLNYGGFGLHPSTQLGQKKKNQKNPHNPIITIKIIRKISPHQAHVTQLKDLLGACAPRGAAGDASG